MIYLLGIHSDNSLYEFLSSITILDGGNRTFRVHFDPDYTKGIRFSSRDAAQRQLDVIKKELPEEYGEDGWIEIIEMSEEEYNEG